MTLSYAGIGSRRTPDGEHAVISKLAGMLSDYGWTLRSGGADGADTMWEQAHYGNKEIFLPWRGFNGNASELHAPHHAAYIEAKKHHPAWEKLSAGACKLHARNVQQVLGANLDDPARMVVCWTPGARGEGGTGQAIRIAKAHGVPVFDIADHLNIYEVIRLAESLR